ncbi:MAG: hypothetical protein IID39_06560 [Planctomycetes bacterium]|nr:hypothetical protein [Planctomycetota bacterium]
MALSKPRIHHSPAALSPLALSVAAAGPLLVLAILFATDTMLGSPRKFVYPYSLIAHERLAAAWFPFILLVPMLVACRSVASNEPRRRRLGLCVFGIGYAAIVAWTHVASPNARLEHVFNMRSPSQDGAFMLEARTITSLPDYLRRFPELLQRSPEELRNVRVLSNPPGATMLAYGVLKLQPLVPGLYERVERLVIAGEEGVDDPHLEYAQDECLTAVFTLLWGLSIIFAYGLARLWLAPLPALVVAVACVFNPTSLPFAPGKDPAQLLTALAILYCWFRGYMRGGWWWPAAAGALTVFGAMLSLVHIWIALIALIATIWHASGKYDQHSPSRRNAPNPSRPPKADKGAIERGHAPPFPDPDGHRDGSVLPAALRMCLLPAAAGAAVVSLIAYSWMDWNIPLTLIATARRYISLQEDVLISPFYYNLLGGGIFLLFVGPTFWMLLTLALASRGMASQRAALGGHERASTCSPHASRGESMPPAARLGRHLLICTAAVMLYTYLFAQNAEVPRLWTVFVPLLILPLALIVPHFRHTRRVGHDASSAWSKGLLIAILACQTYGTLLHWSLMDVRGTETRLVTGRYFEG